MPSISSSTRPSASRSPQTRRLLIIEAYGKLKKLRQILGSGYTVLASGGHIRELANDGVDRLGFDLDGDRVMCRWEPRGNQGKKAIAELRAAVKQADEVILATDEDREGEGIAWHLAQALRLKNPQRITYREITPQAVQTALQHPRPLNQALVNASLCRSVLDKLVGYRGSPLVWSLNNGAKSVGRVQSATLHLVVDRELAIRNFQPTPYWSVFVDYAEGFRAFYWGGKRSPATADQSVNDAAEATDQQAVESDRVLSQAEADRLVAIARQHPHQVVSIDGKLVHRSPPPPFTTSTLQQAAGAKLKFPPERTMQLAQHLYEQGHITYMRTDATFLNPEFVESARRWLAEHDPTNLPQKSTQHRASKHAQEAHEAIRPTQIERSSESLRAELDADAFALYVLIWKRTIASLCASARIRQTRILTRSGTVHWQAKGQVVEFWGFARYWKALGEEVELPTVQPGQALVLKNAAHERKETQPPPRYSESQLVQLMERKGIGRPSTYAPTIQTLKQRSYVEVVKGKLHPTEVGMQVDRFLCQALPKLVDTHFTAEMEERLDAIAAGNLHWERWLTGWNHDYFAPALDQARQVLPTFAAIAPTHPSAVLSQVQCPQCQQPLAQIKSRKLKKGYFLKCQSCINSVLFWSDRANQWEAPRSQAETTVATVEPTDYICPVCQRPLECYQYQKDGQIKQMLRCSDAKARQQSNHQEAVYFRSSRGGFWSPKFGDATSSSSETGSTSKSRSATQRQP